MIPRDEAFYMESGGRRLLTVFQPASADARFGVLFCHPFGEEKKCAHRAFVVTARALAAQNVASLRFDMTGCGDSEGEFGEVRFADWIRDIAVAWVELGRRVPSKSLALLGLRLGAALAALACPKLEGVAALILWQPMVDGKVEFAAELRRLLIQQMMTHGKARQRQKDILDAFKRGEGKAELDGYPISAALFEDISNIVLANNIKPPPRGGVVQFSRSHRRVEAFAEATGMDAAVVDVPPIWIRSDFIPTRETGELLAREGVLRWIGLAHRMSGGLARRSSGGSA